MKEVVVCISPKGEELEKLSRLMNSVSEKVGSNKALIFPPHITVVHRIHTDNYEGMVDEIRTSIKSVKSFKLEFNKIDCFNEQHIIFLELLEQKPIVVLHNLLLPVVVKYKDEWVRDAFLKLDVVAKQKEYIKKYGSPYVKEFFTVHLTLAGPDVDSVKFESFTKQKSIMNPVIITVDEICLMVKINNEWKIDMRLPLK